MDGRWKDGRWKDGRWTEDGRKMDSGGVLKVRQKYPVRLVLEDIARTT
jgi:hypothetical protein